VPIKASSTKQIAALVADLGAASDIIREAAVARLILIGGRAVGRLVTVADSDAPGPTRIGAFRVLDAIGHPRALAPALRAIDDTDSKVAIAAVAVARRFLRSAPGAAAVDRLTATALDRTQPNDVRVAALHALRDLDPLTVAPLLKSLAGDPVAAMSAEPSVPDEARAIRQTVASRGGDVALSELLRLVEQVRDREAAAAANRREEWATARAAVHLALAKRGSRIALYDLREWLETARQPLPVESLAALSVKRCLVARSARGCVSSDFETRTAHEAKRGAEEDREEVARYVSATRWLATNPPTFFHWRRGPTPGAN